MFLAMGWLLLFFAMPAVTAASGDSRPGMPELSRSLEELATRVTPSVVRIIATMHGSAPEGQKDGELWLSRERRNGSGAILSPDGYIITNAHVAQGAHLLHVVLSLPAAPEAPGRSILRPAGRRLPARLIGVDEETDLAVLKVESEKLPYLSFGDSDGVRPGQLVLAFGAPLGLENSVTMGVVSAVGRQIKPEDRMVYIQTDTPINPGNSGGPLVNTEGDLVGINTLIFSQSGGHEGIGFAAPSNIARRVFEQIRATGRVQRGEIGTFAQTITPVLATGLGLSRNWGAILADVYPEGPAAAAGLKSGDIVLSLNGKPMENGRQLDVNLYRIPAGETVRLDVLRGERKLTIHVPVVERPEEPDVSERISPGRNLIPRLGILGITMDEEIAQMLPWLRQDEGVFVALKVDDPLLAEDGDLETGDIIQAVNGHPITSVSELRAKTDAARTGDPIVLHVNRRGRLRYIAFETE
jgi:serine protease Do